jgi:hypothetical protein
MAPNLKSDGNTLKLLMQRGSQQHLRTIMNEPESKLIESALSGNITKDGITDWKIPTGHLRSSIPTELPLYGMICFHQIMQLMMNSTKPLPNTVWLLLMTTKMLFSSLKTIANCA